MTAIVLTIFRQSKAWTLCGCTHECSLWDGTLGTGQKCHGSHNPSAS